MLGTGRAYAARSRTPRLTATLLMAAMLLPAILGAVAPAWAEAPAGPALRAIAVFDRFEDVPGDDYFASRSLEVSRRLFAIPGVTVSGPDAALLALETHPRIAYVERDRPQEYFLSTAVFSTNAADVWGNAWWPVASEVQRKTPSPLTVNGDVIDGSGVVVAVVDSGINAAHPDLWYAPAHTGAMPWEPKVLACINVPEVTTVADQPYCDETIGHGTHVAGIVAGNAFAARNGMAAGVDPDHPPMGAAPGAKLVGLGLGAGLFILNAVEALDYVAENHQRWGIRVVTNSWGGAGVCSQGMPGSAINAISNNLIDQGITVLFANGNYDNLGNPTLSSPHAINPRPGLIAVANYNDQGTGSRDGSIAGSSSDGCSGTAGADLLWTWPDVSAPGSSITSTAAWTGSLIPPTSGGFYGTASGTSMATPHVAGIVALMLEANPALTPAQIERILIETATPFSDGTGARGIAGTSMWGSAAVNNPIAGFADPGLCRVTPADAAKAELGDTSVNGKFPLFTTLATLTDADLFVCRDFKRGRGLVDAYAAVSKAIELRGDPGGSPAVTIESPAAGSQVAAGLTTVSGLVDRAGGTANVAPTAGLSADRLSGTAPLAVTFTLLGSDSDGTIASWSLDFGDGSAAATGTTLPASQPHTYGANGDYTATLTVVDDDGATGTATLDISVGGLPVPDGTYTGSVFAYNLGAVGVSNVGAIVVGAATGDNVPKYVAGELVGASSRSTIGPGLAATTPAQLEIYDADGNLAFGPLPMTGSAENPTLAGCTDCYSYRTPNFQIPVTFGGRYYLAVKLTVAGTSFYVFDPAYGGLKPIDVVGPGLVTSDPPALPTSWDDVAGTPASRDSPPVAFGSREDPEATDPPNDTTGDLAFMDVLKVWVGLEDADSFDVHVQVDDMSSQPPSISASPVRLAVNYGIELCLNNNLNSANAADGTFCYRFSAVNTVNAGPVFSGGVIQRDGTGSCTIANLVETGSFDIPNDTVSWRIRRAALNVTQNSANVAACTSAPIVRGGNPVRDGDVLSLLEGSTGFSAGAVVILTTGAGGDATDPAGARPYTFGGPQEPLLADAGGPYTGMPGAGIAIAGSASGGTPPYSCAWTGAGTFAQPGACLTTVTFAAAGPQSITLTITDSDGASASDSASVDVGSPSGERVALFLDLEGTPRATVSVSTSQADPSEAWSSSLDLTGLTGQHTITAKWFDSADALLDSDAVTVTIQSQGAQAFARIDTPVHDPTGTTPLSGVIDLAGEAGHVGTMAMGGPGLHRSSLDALRPTVREGGILAPCPRCQGTAATNPALGGSVTWLQSDPGGPSDGVDGRWLAVAGFEGATYTLDAEFGSPMDIWFFEDVLDLQNAAKASNASPTMPKTGTVPAGSNWAFVYIRTPTADGVTALQGFDDNAMLTLTLAAVLPGPPQLLEATPGVGEVTLNWLAPMSDGGAAISGYKVYRDGALVTTLPGTTLVHTDSGLTAGQSYSFEVSAANSAGEGDRAGPVAAVPLANVSAVALDITSPADGATGIASDATLRGTYEPRGGNVTPPPSGNFANTYYFFLMNLNNVQCSQDLGHGDILIASKLVAHARDVLGVPDANLRFFNENGTPLCRGDDPGNHDQLPLDWQEPNNPFDGPAKMSAFVPSLRQAAQAAVDGEEANGAPARIFIMQSSHGFYSPQASHVTGSNMALNGESVNDRTFGEAITAAIDDAEAGTTVDIESLVTVDCSFCGGFGDSPLWFPGTTTTAVDSAKVVGPNRVVEVGCTWITECFGNPAVAYDHFYNECVFNGKADGYGPFAETGTGGNPPPTGTGDPGKDVVLGDAAHHAKDGAITFEEAYWCGLESVKTTLDVIGIQQMFQLVDQMDGDLFGSEGFVLWDVNRNLGLGTRDPGQPLPPLSLDLPRTSAPDEEGDAKTPSSDFLQLDATATSDRVVVDMTIADLTLQSAEFEDVIEFRVRVNGQQFGVCYVRGEATVYDYDGAAGYVDAPVAYNFATNVVHVEFPFTLLGDATLPAGVFATSQYGECSQILPVEDDRIPDTGEVFTSGGGDPPVDPGINEVRLRLDGPGASVLSGLAVLDAAAKTWSFDPVGDLAEGTYTASAEHWFDDGSGIARIEGPVSITFTVGAPDIAAPTAPANLFVAGTTSTTASLVWEAANDNVGVARYNLYRSGASGVQALPANLAGSTNGLTFVDQGLAPSTDYYYAVAAEDAAGNEGPLSNERRATTDAPPPITEKVTLLLDGALLAEISVDTVSGPDPASWSHSLDTAALSNGFHDLVAAYDDGRGSTANDAARFYVQNGVTITIVDPADGDAVSQAFDISGTTAGAAAGSAVQVRVSDGAGIVRDWNAADTYDGTAWSESVQGMPLGALTIDARLRDGTVTVAQDSVAVNVFDSDRILIETANGQAVGDDILGPFSGVVDVQGSSSLADPADPRANTPPVAVIGEPVVVGKALSVSGAGSYDPDGSIVAWAWSLGDGAKRSGASLSHEYADAATYTLTLTVTDNRGSVGQASTTITTSDTIPEALAVDAGDSRFVALGQPITLSAQAFGATQPVAFAWDTNGDGTFDRNGQTIQVQTTGLAPGGRTFTVSGVDGAGKRGTDSVKVFLYEPATVTHTFSELIPVGVPDELAVSGLDQGNREHTISVPAGSTALDALLNWTVYAEVFADGTPVFGRGGPNDFDLYVDGPDGFSISAADFNRPEEVRLEDPAGGDWTFRVVPFLTVPDTYTLTVDVEVAPPSPIPTADQLNEVCFQTATQILQAVADVATGDLITGAWDLDADGFFDDATGLTAETSFPLDGNAHLVRFRATTSQGFRVTIFLGVRPMVDCPDAPSVVVIGVADSGINPYSLQFAGDQVPYPALKAFTTVDPDIQLTGDVQVRHKLTNAMLPFTRHPSRYIPGFPADAAPLVLTLGGGFYKAQDEQRVWAQGHGAIPLGKWFWIPGTKIIGAMDASDSAAINGGADVQPIIDEDGHGTGSAAVAVGNTVGSCPRCVLAFIEGLSGDTILMQQPWIDLVSFSFGSVGNVGTPVVSVEEVSRAAAERGQTVSYAAGNGNENAFVTPQNTYTSNSLGPDWTVDVGAVSKSTNSVVSGTGKPVDWSSYGSGNIPGACTNNYAGTCGHSGTSAATPISTGFMGAVLLNARQALGETRAGQRSPAEANGVRQAIGVGAAIPASPYLNDGVLQRHELWNVAFHCASNFGTSVGFPGTLPGSSADHVYGGYGIADAAMSLCATNALLTGAPLPFQGDADAFFAQDERIRDALWGDWDGDGDGQPGGNHNGPSSVPALPALEVAEVDADSEVTRKWRSLLEGAGQLQAAPGYAETYYLHHRGGCDATDGGTDYMDQQDTTGDFDGCGVAGGPPLFGEAVGPSFTWPSEVPSEGFATGARVTGTLYLDYNHPGAPQVQAVLMADGVEVGRSAPIQPVAIAPAFGISVFRWTPYPLDFVLPAAIAQGATLQLDLYVRGSEAVFAGYEGDHTSRFTVTGDGGIGPALTVAISSPAQGAEFDNVVQPSVTISGTATFPTGAGAAVHVAIDDPTFASGTLTVTGTGSWSATWSISGVSPGQHTIYARAVEGAQTSAVASVGVLVKAPQSSRAGAVEVQVLREGNLPVPADWVAATTYDATSGAWSYAWDTNGLPNGNFDVHARLLGDGTEAARDAFRAFLRNSRAPVLGDVADQVVVEGNLLTIGLTATDLDDDALTLSAQDLPEGATLQDHGDGTATFRWVPRFDQAGSYQVTFEASDGGASDTDTITIVVDEARAALLSDGRGHRLVQGAIGAALAGDTVVVLPGSHPEAVTIGAGNITLCSTTGAVLLPADVRCIANPAGASLTSALLQGASDAVRDLTFSPASGPGLRLEGADARVQGNVLQGGGVLAQGAGARLSANRYEDVGTAIAIEGARDVQAIGERIDGAALVLSVGPGAASPAGAVLQESCVRDAARFVDVLAGVSGVEVDARINDWGTYTNSSVRAGVDEGAGNTVLTYPFLDSDCATPLLRPVASFARDADPIYAVVDDVQFTDTSTIAPGSRAIVAWAWAFGDGATSAVQHPRHTYAAPGTYTVTLTITDGAELQHTTSQVLDLLRWLAPTAGLAASPNPTDRITPVQFTDTSTAGTGSIVERLLEFGDGESTLDSNAQHTYDTLGTFVAKLTVTDNKGQSSNATLSIEVRNLPPIAAFDHTPVDPYDVDLVQFSDASTDADGTIAAWAWDFGDGATSSAQDPTHLFATAGTYSVSLTATDSDGATHTASVAVLVAHWFPPNAVLTASPNPTDRITPVQFTDSSTPGTGTIESRLLEFGDGANSTTTTTQHTYATLGTFTARLTLTDNKSQVSTATLSIEVRNLPPVAAGSADRTETDRLTAVQFTDASTDADGTVVGWLWDFGDGTTSTAQNPSHTYASLGTKTVTLTATDSDGGTDSVEVAKIKVKNVKPKAQAAETPAEADRVNAVQFTDQSTDPDGSIASWRWDFGDGTSSTAQNPSHLYTSLGTFTVKLNITDDDGDTDALQRTITVVNLVPVVGFSVDPEHPMTFTPTTFEDQSTDADGNVVGWRWDFGDGATSTQQDPMHVYLAGGTYQVNLTARDNDGAAVRVSRLIFVCQPGLSLNSLIELEHIRLEYEACLRLSSVLS